MIEKGAGGGERSEPGIFIHEVKNGMDSYSRLKQRILEDLITEYAKTQPEIDKGELLKNQSYYQLSLYQIASLLAELKVKRLLDSSMLNQRNVLKSIAEDESQRWEDFSQTVRRIGMILNSLSVPLKCIGEIDKQNRIHHLKAMERSFSNSIVSLIESKKTMNQIKKNRIKPNTSLAKTTFLDYFNQIVFQLKLLIKVFKLELNYGNTLLQHSPEVLDLLFTKLKNNPTSLHLCQEPLNRLYKSMMGNPQLNLGEEWKDSDANAAGGANEIKAKLESAAHALKSTLQDNRKKIDEWVRVIATLEILSNAVENNDDKRIDDLVDRTAGGSGEPRMARYLNAFDKWKDYFSFR